MGSSAGPALGAGAGADAAPPQELGYDTDAPTGNVFLMSNVDQTMANTYEQTRDFIMSMGFTEAEARTMITTAVDFSTTQLVDGNW